MTDTVNVKKGDYIVSDVSLEGSEHSFSPGQVLHVGEDITVEFAQALVSGDEPRAHTIDSDHGKRVRADQKAAIAANLAGGLNEIPRPAEVRAEEKPPEQPEPPAGDDAQNNQSPDEESTGEERTLEAALANGGDDGSGEDEASFEGDDEAGDESGDESKGEEDEVAPDEEQQRGAADEAEHATSPQAETRETATPKRGRKRVKPPEDGDDAA